MRILNEDQGMIRESAAGFLAERAGAAALRCARDGGGGGGAALHAEMAAMGWAGLMLPEEMGGVDLGAEAAGIIAEEMGRSLALSPFLSSSVMSATVLRLAERGAAGRALAEGESICAFAMDEARRHAPTRIETRAEAAGNGFVLSGAKRFVDAGTAADRLIVSARLEGDLALFLVDPEAQGVTRDALATLDARDAANIKFESVSLDGDALLATGTAAEEMLGKALRAGRAVASAELLGVAKESAARTTAYLKERKQFGVPLSSFQALQHRAADLYTQIQTTEAISAAALRAIDAGTGNAEYLSRVAKAKASKTAMQAAREAVQMHGGIGMTDALDIGLFMKKARSAAEYLGDEACHGGWILRQKGL